MHDVYVLIPGILGSVLQKDDQDVFGLTAEAGFRLLFSGGKSIASLELHEDPWKLREPGDETLLEVPDLGDGVTANRLAPDAHLVPGLWKVDGYTKVGDFLQRRLDLVKGEDYFEFPYDWRRDNRAAAHLLAAKSGEWLSQRREKYPDAQLILLGHSMGGLVSRYFLEVLGGWRDTRRLITFGTPYRGSLNAVDFAANGFKRFFGLVDLTDLMCSFTSVQQLLPIYPCIDIGASEMVRLPDAPEVLPRLTSDKIDAARAFHREIEDAVGRNQKEEEYVERGYHVRPVVGTEQPTLQSAVWKDGKLGLMRTYREKDLGGDGTVPRVSASPQEADSDEDAMFSSDKHASLQNADAVLTQVRGWINSVDLGDFMASIPVSMSVDVAEVHQAGQGVNMQLTPSAATSGVGVSLTWVGGPVQPAEPVMSVSLPVVDGVTEVDLSAEEVGAYRLRVTGDEIEEVTDLIVVAPA